MEETKKNGRRRLVVVLLDSLVAGGLGVGVASEAPVRTTSVRSGCGKRNVPTCRGLEDAAVNLECSKML